MTARLTTLLIWAAVLAGAVAWGLPLFTRGTPVPAGASLAQPAAPAGGSLVRLLGQPPAAPVVEQAVAPAPSRFQLLGVVAPRRDGGSGLALIAVDGKPARAVAVGRDLEPGLRLLRVAHREAALGPAGGTATVTLSLPPLAEAQRGRPADLPGMGGPATPGMPPAMAGMPGVPGTPGAAGVPGAMRVPPMGAARLPVPQPMQVPPQQPMLQQQAGQPEQPGTVPYQQDGGLLPQR
jgi:general secretion pathway protein C